MQYTPAIGDFLIREKALGFIDHVGVWVGPNTVIQNTPPKGEHLASVPEFAAGEPVKVVATGADPIRVMARVRQILANAKPYHPISRNCEHTANEVVRGFARSPQLALFVGFGIIALLLILVWPRR